MQVIVGPPRAVDEMDRGHREQEDIGKKDATEAPGPGPQDQTGACADKPLKVVQQQARGERVTHSGSRLMRACREVSGPGHAIAAAKEHA